VPTAPGFADISVRLQQTGLTRPAFITFGVDPVSTDPSQVATSVHTAYAGAGSLNSIMDSSVTTTGVRVSLGTDGAADLVYQAEFTTVGGNSISNSLPPNCAVLARKATSRGGRRGRGRLYIPWCVAETGVDEAGIIAGANRTPINTALQTFLTALGVNNVPMVLLHNPGLTAPGPPDTVLSLVCDSLIATQRRRLGR
jgi:hypothetical protein